MKQNFKKINMELMNVLKELKNKQDRSNGMYHTQHKYIHSQMNHTEPKMSYNRTQTLMLGNGRTLEIKENRDEKEIKRLCKIIKQNNKILINQIRNRKLKDPNKKNIDEFIEFLRSEE
jgi:hypothetical protein